MLKDAEAAWERTMTVNETTEQFKQWTYSVDEGDTVGKIRRWLSVDEGGDDGENWTKVDRRSKKKKHSSSSSYAGGNPTTVGGQANWTLREQGTQLEVVREDREIFPYLAAFHGQAEKVKGRALS